MGYLALTGSSLPYSGESLISSTCISCKNVDEDANQDDAYEAEDQVKEVCEEMYMAAGKWESNTQLRPHVTILKESRLQRMRVSSELVPHGQAKVHLLPLDYLQPQLFSLVHTFTSFRPSLSARSVFRANSAKYP